MKFYVPSTKAYRVSGSYDLFPQHCILPTFTPEQHASEVHRELFESIQTLNKSAKCKFLKKIAKALDILNTTPEQRVASEGETTDHPEDALPLQRVVEHPTVTTSANPTDPKELRAKPRTHQRTTRNNIPNRLPAIINPVNDHTPCRSQQLAPDDAPGDRKTGEKGTNTMFVMTHAQVCDYHETVSSPMGALSWTTNHKRMIPIVFASPLAAI
jgi:hypothetical protein